MLLSATDKQAISYAITSAEKKTRGEIFCVIARQSGNYFETPLLWSSLIATLIPLFFLLFMLIAPRVAVDLYERVLPWHSAQSQESLIQDFITYGLMGICALQVLGALLCYGMCSRTTIRQALTPGFAKRQACHQQALNQFMAQGLHVTAARTGVLIYVSVAERYAEIIADEGIYQRVDPSIWRATVSELTAAIRNGQAKLGFIKAIEACGLVLAEHFPKAGPDANELPDRVIEI